MKLLLTVHQFFPHGAGGTEVLACHTARELQRRGHDVTIFAAQPCPEDMPPEQRFDDYVFEGLKVHRFHHAYTSLADQVIETEIEYKNLFLYHHFKQFLREQDFDLVHYFHLHRLGGLAVDAAVELAIPTVFTPTDFWTICPTSQLRLPDNSVCEGPDPSAINCIRHIAHGQQIGRKLEYLPDALVQLSVSAIRRGWFADRWYSPHVKAVVDRGPFLRDRLNRIDRVLPPTRLMERLLLKNGLDPARARFMPYGIDVSCIPRHTDKGVHPRLRLGFVGSLLEHKGAHLLVEAVRGLPREANVELAVYGNLDESPLYTARLRSLADQDPRIRFPGTFPHSQIGAIFSHLDVLVVPSIWYENTPLVIYTAHAAGVPLVVTDLGGMAEAVESEVNGLLFERGNVAELRAHLQRLAADRPLVARLAALTRPPKTIPIYVSELETLYYELLPAKH